jgi:hypothetical protein
VLRILRFGDLIRKTMWFYSQKSTVIFPEECTDILLKISEPYNNPFWEKSMWQRKKKDKLG